MPSGKYDHSWQYVVWTPEEDAILINNWRDHTYKQLREMLIAHGKKVAVETLRRRLIALNVMSESGKRLRVTQDMLDYVYVHRNLQIRTLTRRFNDNFGTDFSHMKIYRVLLDAKGERGHRLTAKEFAEKWVEVQDKFADQPDQVAPPHWLWRWKRFNRTTTSGAVFRGRKEPVPTFFNAEQFANEWRKMQRQFGVTT